MNLNKVFLLGNLTNDPQLRNLPSGQTVCTFGMATNRNWTDKETGEKKQKAEFHNIVVWRKLATIVAQYLKKGSLILVEGRLTTRNWDDPSSGIKKYKTEIVAENIQFGPKRTGTGQETPTETPESPVLETQDSDQSDKNEEKDSSASEEIPTIQEGDDIDINEVPF